MPRRNPTARVSIVLLVGVFLLTALIVSSCAGSPSDGFSAWFETIALDRPSADSDDSGAAALVLLPTPTPSELVETISAASSAAAAGAVATQLVLTPTPTVVVASVEAGQDVTGTLPADDAETVGAETVVSTGTVAEDENPAVDADARITESLQAGQVVTVTESSVVTEALVVTDSATITTVVAPAVLPAGVELSPTLFVVEVTVDRLNVRGGPGVDFPVVAKLLIGDRAAVIGQNGVGSWYRVNLESVTSESWVASAYVQEREEALAVAARVEESETVAAEEVVTQDAEATPADPEPNVPTALVQPERMNVRGGPGTNYPVVGNVTAGSALLILATNEMGDWYQVQIEGQDEPGWLYAPLTTPAGPVETLEPLPAEEIPALPTPPEEPQTVPAETQPAPVAVSAPPPSGGGFFGYGVQAHMLGGGIGQAMDATSRLGFNWIKQQVQWRDFEGSPGAVDFSELRRIVDAAGGRGISVLFSVVNAPDWAREPGFDGSVGGPPQDPQTYANFVGRLAGEFCGSGLKAIEVWNEQNLHYEWGNKPLNPADYMNLLRPAYASIKAACPSMLVISGALTPAGDAGPLARDDFAYLEGMYQNGLRNYADGIGAHPSGYNVPPSVGWQQACATIQQTGNTFNGPCDTPHHSWSFRSTMEGYRNIMLVYGDGSKRIWPTEFGWAIGPAVNGAYAYANDNSPEEQAAWTVEAFQTMRNWGWVGPAFLWNLNFRVVADGTEKAQWGIVRNDYSPMPVYQALQQMPK